MGYRSEVILAVGPEVMPQFMVTMAKSPEARKMCWGEHDNMIKVYSGVEGAFLFYWNDIKWYDSYKEIQAIEDFIDWCENADIEVDGEMHNAAEYFRFVRIGEEMDDNEVKGWGFDICIERSASY